MRNFSSMLNFWRSAVASKCWPPDGVVIHAGIKFRQLNGDIDWRNGVKRRRVYFEPD